MTQVTRQKFDNLVPAQQVGILCNDDRFRRFAAIRSGFPGDDFTQTAAAEYVRQVCRVESRKQLNSDWNALNRFNQLRTEFDAWLGKISTHR